MILRLASRYAFSLNMNHRSRAIRTLCLTAISVLMVTIILSVMSSLQSARFDAIRRVRSFDIVVDGRVRDEIAPLLPSSKVFEYGEGEALLDGSAYFVRYIDQDYLGGLELLVGNASSLLGSVQFFDRKNRALRSNIGVYTLQPGKSGAIVPRTTYYDVSGIYRTAMGSEFDYSYIFLPIAEANSNVSFKTAVLNGGREELRTLRALGYNARSWMDQERSLYAAFALERFMMYVVLSLLFIAIAVSERQSVRIFFTTRRRERAELIILGEGRGRCNAAFTLSFLIVAIAAIVLSALLALIILPLLERLTQTPYFLTLRLTFPVFPFIIFSSFLVIITILFALLEIRREDKLSLVEVIYGSL